MTVATLQSDLTAHDIAQIHSIVEPWTRACLTRDWDALLSFCTEDITFLPPGGPPISGAEVRPWLDSFPPIKAMSWDIKHIEARSGLGTLRGSVRQTIQIDGQDVPFDGKYCDIIRKEADGKWRFAVVIWNSNTTP
jgi:ketosteroid isomerase-like protein